MPERGLFELTVADLHSEIGVLRHNLDKHHFSLERELEELALLARPFHQVPVKTLLRTRALKSNHDHRLVRANPEAS